MGGWAVVISDGEGLGKERRKVRGARYESSFATSWASDYTAPMNAKDIAVALFYPRPEASPIPYGVMVFPLIFMGLFAAHEGWEAVLPEVILIVFCGLQFKYRIYFGWVLLAGLWTFYAGAIILEVLKSDTSDLIFGPVIGPLPLIPIFWFRPRFASFKK
jgi:hypothetical protein